MSLTDMETYKELEVNVDDYDTLYTPYSTVLGVAPLPDGETLKINDNGPTKITTKHLVIDESKLRASRVRPSTGNILHSGMMEVEESYIMEVSGFQSDVSINADEKRKERLNNTNLSLKLEKWDVDNLFGKYGVTTYVDDREFIKDIKVDPISCTTDSSKNYNQQDIYYKVNDVFQKLFKGVRSSKNAPVEGVTGTPDGVQYIIMLFGEELQTFMNNQFVKEFSSSKIRDDIESYATKMFGYGKYLFVDVPDTTLEAFNNSHGKNIKQENQIVVWNTQAAGILDPFGLDQDISKTINTHSYNPKIATYYYWATTLVLANSNKCVMRAKIPLVNVK